MDLIYNSKYYDSKLEKEIDFKYRTELTLQQKVSFVNFVLGVIFDDDYCFSIIKYKPSFFRVPLYPNKRSIEQSLRDETNSHE